MHKFCPIIPKVIRNLFVGSIHRKNKVQIGVLQLVKLQVTTGVPSFVIISCVLTNHILCIRSEEHTLNSSHVRISYAVFCLKKKKQTAPASARARRRFSRSPRSEEH